MSEHEPVALSAGKLRLELSPSVGGSISAFEWEDGGARLPILRHCSRPPQNSLSSCCFPLVPFVNRIRGGEFHFRGRDVRLEPNMAGDPSPLHGQGWLSPWTLEEANDRRAVLHFSHDAGEWPWSYTARQEFMLDGEGLTVNLSCTNLSEAPMPCGLGEHPYFHCGPQTRIDTLVTDAWTIDKNVLPLEKVPAKGRYDLKSRCICGQDLDNGFGGWGGDVRISDPDWPFDLRMSSPNADFFQIYSPPTGGIFVAEPVTHANAALNEPEAKWPELGMRVLDKGGEMSMSMRLDLIVR